MKKVTVFAVIVAALVPAIWLAHKLGDRTLEHHLITQAGRAIDDRDFRNASLLLRRAIAINPVDARAYRLMADLLEDTHSGAALDWRICAAQLATNEVEYRFAWARTALRQKNLPSAIQAVRGIGDNYRTSAEFYEIQAGMEWNLHDLPEADQDFSHALALEPTNLAVALDLSAVELASTNQALSDTARGALQKFPNNSPLHLTARRYLITDAVAHKRYDDAMLYSQLVVEDPESSYDDKLALLDILQAAKSPRLASWLGTLQAQSTTSVTNAAALGHWMQIRQSPDVALQWLRTLPPVTQTNYPVPIIITDCQLALHDWKGLQTYVDKADWRRFDYYRLLLSSIAARNLGQTAASEAAWREAFQLSFQHLDRLIKLAEITASWGWTSERGRVLEKISLEFPDQTWADQQLAALYYANGQTQQLAGLLDRMSSSDPSDVRLKTDLATILLLQKTEPDKARRLALESYNTSTNNPFCMCTYAYSLLVQSKPAEAVKVLGSMNPGYLKNPSIAGLYGVVQAQTGHKDAAREPLKVASAAPLLPEELALVREAMARE